MDYRVTKLRKSYGPHAILDGIDLACEPGGITVLLGPSGCGKTSLLNILAGIDGEFEGNIGDFLLTGTSCVFQEDRLLPWLSAEDNVAFILKPYMRETERRKKAAEALSSMGLSENRHMLPGMLSGGMKRRVALARAFACPSPVMLLDEPFGSLDLKTRISVMDAFLEVRKSDGRTALVVTHDVREAIYLGDTIITLSEKPARVLETHRVDLKKEDRAFASPAAAGIEARLYDAILNRT